MYGKVWLGSIFYTLLKTATAATSIAAGKHTEDITANSRNYETVDQIHYLKKMEFPRGFHKEI